MAGTVKKTRTPKKAVEEVPKEYVETDEAEDFQRDSTTVTAEVGRVGINMGEQVKNWRGNYKEIKPETEGQRLARLQEMDPEDIVLTPGPGFDYSAKNEGKGNNLGIVLPEY